MNFKHNSEKIWLENEDGKTIAEIDFPETAPMTVTIWHTEVDESLRGQKVAGKLVQAAADQLRSEGRKAIVTCSYASRWFNHHPEYDDVLLDAAKEHERAKETVGNACGLKPRKA